MSLLDAIIIGIVQGLTEFIPISSTAHMTLVGSMLGTMSKDNPELWTAIQGVFQLGTLVAVFAYFSKDLRNILLEFYNQNLSKRVSFSSQTSNSKLGWYITIGTIPIVTIGYALKKQLTGSFTKDPFVIAIALISLAVVLLIAELISKRTRTLETISMKDSIIVGLSQCLALIPGSSRSGTTITAGLFLGMTRETAARFSFLLGIPAILLSGLASMYDLYKAKEMFISLDIAPIVVGTIVSGIVGYLSIAFLLKFLAKYSTMLFIVYRIVLGIIILYLTF
jgi:undecaprenyl-diphosphatase